MIIRAQAADHLFEPRRVFSLLVIYRWMSLIPPLIWLLLLKGGLRDAPPAPVLLALFGFGIAAFLNVLITRFSDDLNRALLDHPRLLLVDLLLVAVLIAGSEGWRTPYYLYALSPLLAGAFFFRLRGALAAGAAFIVLYLVAVAAAAQINDQPVNWLIVAMVSVGALLLSLTFGFTSELIRKVRLAGEELAGAHRDLQVIHDLTLSLQSASDVNEVQERILTAVTEELGFPQAVVALVDEDEQAITSWMGRGRSGFLDSFLPHSARLPLRVDGGAVSQVLLQGQAQLAAGPPLTNDDGIDPFLVMKSAHIFPLMLREHSVGVLIVDAEDGREDTAHFHSLQAIANQAAVSLGATMMCIDRAQRLAVQEERIRIARDIHDTVSQSLFGIVFTLDGCLKLLDEQPDVVALELRRVLKVAEETRAEVRRSILDIWPSEMTAGSFVADLQKFAADICQVGDLRMDFDVAGDFTLLSPLVRRSLYRISQEALANVAHHAQASQVDVRLEILPGRAMLKVRDDGCGFEPEKVLRREYGRDHFGLWGMQERARSLDGVCEIDSSPGSGTTIVVELPLV
jgi:signal transduction histidine kinase